MRLRLTLALPRDWRTVPLARHVLHRCLEDLRVTEECAFDIEVALTEACANALDHAQGATDYEVRVEFDDDACTICIVDRGHGVDWDRWSPGDGASERGRGITLMRHLVDAVGFAVTPGEGAQVELHKTLEFASVP